MGDFPLMERRIERAEALFEEAPVLTMGDFLKKFIKNREKTMLSRCSYPGS
jgi:hypothetical protein